MNWMQVQEYLTRDDRAVIPLGSTEQHAYLSLATDAILSERVAVEAAEPLGVPVFPVVAYGITPYFLAFPGSVSLRVSTYVAMVGDILDSLHGQGFRRFLLVNGHGGNSPAGSFAAEWMARHPGTKIVFHNWWNAPDTLQGRAGRRCVRVAWLLDGELSLEPRCSHALGGETAGRYKCPSRARTARSEGADRRWQLRRRLREARRADARVWRAGVEETRRLIDGL